VRRPFLLAAVPAAAVVLAACGSSTKTTTSAAPATTPAKTTPAKTTPATTTAATTPAHPTTGGTKVSTASVDGLGPVLVNAQGRVLYTFVPDNAKKVTCVGACAAVWPPLKLSGSKATGSGSVKASLLGSDPNPSGGSVVTYAGWPLYTYVADTGPGKASGQAINLNGGLWYVISPSGTVIKKKPTSASVSSPSSTY
jgi:predicted lipoprotein with Yx(FWY)xxD motif